jgi:hypothetical protein
LKVDKKSISNLSNRLDRIEEEIGLAVSSEHQQSLELEQELDQARLATTDLCEEFVSKFYSLPPYARSKIYDKLSEEEKDKLHEFRFNWYVKNILPYYKQEVCHVYNISSEEYDRRTLNADESIYLPQPYPKFESTWYSERVAHVLGLDYKGFQDKVRKGELEDKIATGGFGCWRDENPSAVF